MIITISREFGSGGRELGKRLSDELGIPCYDKEIINEVARLHSITPDHVERISQSDIRTIYAGTIGGTLNSPMYFNYQALKIFVAEQEVIRKLAEQGDCVIIGRAADVILRDYDPLNIFVYASKQAKLKRCVERSNSEVNERKLLRKMKQIDKARAANRSTITSSEWGKKETYHLCINTSDTDIKAIAPSLAEYARRWFEARPTKNTEDK